VKKHFSEEKIIGCLREAGAGLPIKELFRKHGFSEAFYYLWRSKFGGMSVPNAKCLKELETENTRLKKLLAEQMLENEVIWGVLRKNRRRTGPTRVGAPDDRQGAERAVLVAYRGLVVLPHAAQKPAWNSRRGFPHRCPFDRTHQRLTPFPNTRHRCSLPHPGNDLALVEIAH